VVALRQELRNRRETGDAPTLIILMATGWNTATDESIKNFNDWMKGVDVESHGASKPIAIGISWQSTWHGSLEIPSFANKSNDADEIGFTWANELVNRYILLLASDETLPSVANWPQFWNAHPGWSDTRSRPTDEFAAIESAAG
jgi:hypothetical protein